MLKTEYVEADVMESKLCTAYKTVKPEVLLVIAWRCEPNDVRRRYIVRDRNLSIVVQKPL